MPDDADRRGIPQRDADLPSVLRERVRANGQRHTHAEHQPLHDGGSYFVDVSSSRMPPSEAITPLLSYGRNTIFCALLEICPSASRYFCAIRYCAGLPAAPSAWLTSWMACASACATRSRACAWPSAARIAASFDPSALTIAACFWPSARRIADDFSPSAVVTTARRVRSAVICFSIVRRISSGGVMFLSSIRITLTPHCCVAVSSAARSCELVVSREASV